MITRNLMYGFALIVFVGGLSAISVMVLHLLLKSKQDLTADRMLLLRKIKLRFAELLMVTVSIATTLVVFDIGLRTFTRPDNPPGYTIKHPTRGHALRPGFQGHTYDAPLKINNLGIRDREREIKFGQDSLRILVLGDAMTYGIGVPIAETYPSMLERRLQNSRQGSTQVFNLGVPKYNTVDEAIFLEETYDTFQPSIVILQFEMLGNDVAFKPRPRPPDGIKSTALWQFLRDIPERSYALAWVNRQLGQLMFSLRRKNRPSDPLERLASSVEHRLTGEYAEDAVGWLAAQQATARINRFLSSKGVPFIFAISVNYTDMSEGPQKILSPLTNRVMSTIKGLGVSNVLVIDEAFADYAGKESELFLSADDDHWTKLAHSLVADLLISHIESDPRLSAFTRTTN